MCGIAGIFAYHPAADTINRQELETMRNHMALRGPDGAGSWISPEDRVGFAHRRLSIIDLSAVGAQPMVSACGRFVVTFNGEIYNHRALRRRLEAQGHVFSSASDTEVLLQLYAQKGPEMVKDLRGMFAFALLDQKAGTVFLARDPYGIKPLYYADDGGTLRFASQVKALLSGGALSATRDPAGLAGFYLFGSVPEPFTTFAAIKALPAGTTLLAGCNGAGEPGPFFSLAGAYLAAETADGAGKPDPEAVKSALLDSVRQHLTADVPVGAFLSAGIDSGALVGLMRDAGQSEIKTVTLGFAEFAGTPQDETPLAGEVAKLYGTSHATRMVNQREFEEDFPRILAAMDQPSIDGINTWFVSKAAHELGLKVAISGLGGDELLGGYPSFYAVPRLAASMRYPGQIPLLPGATRKLASALIAARPGLSQKWAGLMEYGGSIEGAYLLRRGLFMPWELPSLMGKDVAREGLERLAPLARLSALLNPRPRSDFAKLSILEASLYMRNQLLRDTDWASMAHSLEVRVPLADPVLLGACAPHLLGFSQTAGVCKQLLASSPKHPLPQTVALRAKTGFSTPIGRWLKAAIANANAPSAPYAGQSSRRLAGMVSGAATALTADQAYAWMA